MKIYGTADIVTRQGGYMDSTGHSNPQYITLLEGTMLSK